MRKQKGFTLVELLIAMALFSFVILILAVGVIQLFRIYQAGIGIRNTQQSARLISEELSRTAREAGAAYATNGRVCFYSSSGSGLVAGGKMNVINTTYYVTAGSFAANGFATGYQLRRVKNTSATVTVDTTTTPYAPAPQAADCPAVAGGDQISSNDVAVVLFNASTSQVLRQLPPILNYDLRVASIYAHSDEIDLSNATNPVCVASNRYCSITPVLSSVYLRSQLEPGL